LDGWLVSQPSSPPFGGPAQLVTKSPNMNEEWTAKHVVISGRNEVRVVLLDGAVVYLHPDIADRLGAQLRKAAKQCRDDVENVH
jgi:hypothetical protein